MEKSACKGADSLQERRYHLQFILGPGVPAGYETWQHSVVTDRLQLLAHPSLAVHTAEGEGLSLTLLGYMLDPEHPWAGDADILTHITTQVSRGGELVTAIEPLGGRWVLLVNNQQGLRLFNDASGLRQVFHTTGDSGEVWCASQPDHIASAVRLEKNQDALRFIHWFEAQHREYWWPGTSSHYSGVARLLPNHYVDLETGRAHRFWPRSELRSCRVDEALGRICAQLTGMMQAAAQRFELAIALSAGWDSRLLLAASRPVADQVRYYTVKRPDMDRRHMDVDIPVRLAKQLGLRHDVIEHGREATPAFTRLFNANTPFAHAMRLAALQSEFDYFCGQRTAATGNISEVARCIYPRPDNAAAVECLMSVTGMHHGFARQQFREWLDDLKDPLNYEIADLFYWEQRSGSWFAQNCLEFDSAWQDIFIVFNSRRLLAEMLAVDARARQAPDYSLYRELMLALWPEVLAEPVNPKARRTGSARLIAAVQRRMQRLLH